MVPSATGEVLINDLTSEKVPLPEGHWILGFDRGVAFVGSNSLAVLRRLWCDDLLTMDACSVDGRIYISKPDGTVAWVTDLLTKYSLSNVDMMLASSQLFKLGVLSFEFHVNGAGRFFEVRCLQDGLDLQVAAEHYSKWIMRAWPRWKSESLEWNVPDSHWIASFKGKEEDIRKDPRACQHTYFASVLATLWLLLRWSTSLKKGSEEAAARLLGCKARNSQQSIQTQHPRSMCLHIECLGNRVGPCLNWL